MEIKCANCQKTFNRKPSQIKLAKVHYCSHSCRVASKETTLQPCAYCSKPIKCTKSRLSKAKLGVVFCCKSCSASYINHNLRSGENHPNFKGGITSYRAKALGAMKNECVICGFSNSYALEVHHIDKNRKNSSLDNLMILCANCHLGVHKGVLKI